MRHRNARLRIPVLAVVSIIMAATLLPVQAAAAAPSNVVLNWNATAAAALFNAPTAVPPGAGQATPVAAIHMAMVQGAVFDAVNSIEGGYEPYLDVPYGASGSVGRCGGRDRCEARLEEGDPARGTADGSRRPGRDPRGHPDAVRDRTCRDPGRNREAAGPASGPGSSNRDA